MVFSIRSRNIIFANLNAMQKAIFQRINRQGSLLIIVVLSICIRIVLSRYYLCFQSASDFKDTGQKERT